VSGSSKVELMDTGPFPGRMKKKFCGLTFGLRYRCDEHALSASDAASRCLFGARGGVDMSSPNDGLG
jgi:hypothetical protein